jgi:hypothetical protein
MTTTPVWEPLRKELDYIKSPGIREFVEWALTQAPAYFWTESAAKSGKYHPTKSRGPGGIVHHTRMVVYFALGLIESMECEAWRDEIIAACLLHDSFKNGDGLTKYGTNWAAHGANLRGWLVSKPEWQAYYYESFRPIIDKILDMTAKHMSRWGGSAPRPASREDWVVATADYISSRKLVNIEHFDEEKIP